jgi:hypothetical protein
MITNLLAAQIQVPTDRILERTFFIQTDTLGGACFSVIYKETEFIITAKHLFKKKTTNNSEVKVKIYINGIPKIITAKCFFHKDNNVDIAVLKIPIITSNKGSYDLLGTLIFGQDIYFCGFPSLGGSIYFTNGFIDKPYPIIKKGILSGMIKTNGCSIMLLDGHNNPGFSGGPVVFYDYYVNKYMIGGVISGYLFQENKIAGDTTKKLIVQENSGIILCFDIKNALEIIDNQQN